jgi:opacity protein-like surface antigen
MRASRTLVAALLLAAPVCAQPYDIPPPPPPMDAPPPPPAENNADNGGIAGTYVGLRGSMAFNGNHDTTWAPTSPPTAIRASYATGGGGSVVLGAYLPLNLRLELEALYRWQPLSNFAVGGIATGATGKTQVAAPFLNMLWDIPTGDDIWIHPFVGLGVGAAYTRTDISGGGNNYLRQNRWDLAWSFMGGFALPVDETSRLTAMYRFMQVRDGGHRCAVSGTILTACLDNAIDSQSVDLGYEVDL